MTLLAVGFAPAVLCQSLVPQIELNRDGTIKRIRPSRSFEWLDPVEIAHDSDSRIFMAEPRLLSNGAASDSIEFVGKGVFRTLIVTLYQDNDACLKHAHSEVERQLCDYRWYRADDVRVDYRNQRLTLIPLPVNGEKLSSAQAERAESDFAGLDLLHKRALTRINLAAVALYPQIKMIPEGEPNPPGTPGVKRTPPRLLRKVDPTYSMEAREKGLSGEVILNFTLDTDGRPTHIRVTRPLGLGLDERAAEAVAQWLFTPSTENGRAVPTELNVAVRFQLYPTR